jgi:hypothetical protein
MTIILLLLELEFRNSIATPWGLKSLISNLAIISFDFVMANDVLKKTFIYSGEYEYSNRLDLEEVNI